MIASVCVRVGKSIGPTVPAEGRLGRSLRASIGTMLFLPLAEIRKPEQHRMWYGSTVRQMNRKGRPCRWGWAQDFLKTWFLFVEVSFLPMECRYLQAVPWKGRTSRSYQSPQKRKPCASRRQLTNLPVNRPHEGLRYGMQHGWAALTKSCSSNPRSRETYGTLRKT